MWQGARVPPEIFDRYTVIHEDELNQAIGLLNNVPSVEPFQIPEPGRQKRWRGLEHMNRIRTCLITLSPYIHELQINIMEDVTGPIRNVIVLNGSDYVILAIDLFHDTLDNRISLYNELMQMLTNCKRLDFCKLKIVSLPIFLGSSFYLAFDWLTSLSRQARNVTLEIPDYQNFDEFGIGIPFFTAFHTYLDQNGHLKALGVMQREWPIFPEFKVFLATLEADAKKKTIDNYLAWKVCQKSTLFLLMASRGKRPEMILLSILPHDLVRLIAHYLWSTRFETKIWIWI